MNTARHLLLTSLLAVAIAACSTEKAQTQTAAAPARDELVADMAACTKTHGYDPNTATSLGEHELGKNELPWRECVYDAVRDYTQTHPDLAGQYEQFINEDITMTNAVQSGSMTRAQRRQRLEELIAQIEEAEKKHAMANAANAEEENKKVRQVVDGVRGFSY